MGIRYATRESVKRALDSAETARNNGQVDRAIEAASRSVDSLTHRRFYPEIATRYFDWPDLRRARPWRLWLDRYDLISVTTIVAGGITIPASGYFLEPANQGPPYTHVEINLDSSSSFSAGDTHQRAIVITGMFGYRADEAAAGALAEVLDTTETGVDVTDSAAIGVGDIIRVDNERMIVTGKTMLTTGQTLQTPLTATNAGTLVAVTNGAAYAVDEVVLLDSERMLIVDIAGNNLVVRRAWDGSVLADHTGSTIYAARTLTVERGALGTTAATHNTAAAINRHVPPSIVNQLVVSEALNDLLHQGTGYALNARAEAAQSLISAGGIADLRQRCYDAVGRKARKAAI